MNFFITWTEKPVEMGYHYCVTTKGGSYVAFKTTRDFYIWVERHGFILNKGGEGKSTRRGKYKTWFIDNKTIKEVIFSHKSQVDKKATMYYDLSNGTYAQCYILVGKKENIIYRPNPNNKEVYITFKDSYFNKKPSSLTINKKDNIT